LSEELQEIINSNPNWYKNLQLIDVKEFIRSNMSSASRSFIAIGYYLKYIKVNKLYEQEDYDSIWDFALTEFGISRTWAGRWMSINDRFSKDGNSPILMELYTGFSSSKLAEMLTLTDEQLEQVAITSTVAEIREMKQPEKVCATSHTEPEPEKVAPAQVELECFIKGQINETQDDGLKCSGGISDKCQDCDKSEPEEPRPEESHDEIWFVKWYFDKHPEELAKLMRMCRLTKTSGDIAKEFQKYRSPYGAYYKGCSEWEYRFYSFAGGIDIRVDKEKLHLKYGRLVEEALNLYNPFLPEFDEKPIKEVDDQPRITDTEPENVDNEPEIVNDVDETVTETIETVIEEQESEAEERSCNNCRYNIMSRDEYFSENSDAKEFICDPCGAFDNWEHEADGLVLDCYNQEEGWHKEIILDEQELVETVEADIIQTVPEKPAKPIFSAIHHLREAIQREEEQLKQLGETWKIKQPDTFLKHQTIMIALKCYLTEMEYANIQLSPPAQPELPILKNNDQRQAWIEAYTTWPIWIDQTKTEEKCYRYDFENGEAFVVRVRLHHKYFGWDKGGYSKTETEYNHEEYWIVRQDKLFSDCETNKSAMVDYLKELQKKGV